MIKLVLIVVCLLSTASTFDDDDEESEVSYIEGGYFMDIDEAPWSASIQMLLEDHGEATVPLCYGAIVSPTVIVTAAQCIADHPVSNYRVRVGSWFSASGGQFLEPKWLLIHDEYNPRFHTNDIGLIFFDTLITIDMAKPVPLPLQGDEIEVGEDVTAMGWKLIRQPGDTDDNEVIFNEELQEVEAITMEVGLCQVPDTEIVDADVICAGDPEEDLDTCFAYTGGALMNEEGVMVGIFSWSLGCKDSAPGVYTKVSSHIDWLNDLLNITWINTSSLAKLQLWNS